MKLKFKCPECDSNCLIKEVNNVKTLQHVSIENDRINLGEPVEDYESSVVSRFMCGECNYILAYPNNDDYIVCEEHIIDWIKENCSEEKEKKVKEKEPDKSDNQTEGWRNIIHNLNKD